MPLKLRAAAELELRRRRRVRIEAYGLSDIIPESMTFLQWRQKLPADGMRVDHKPFNLAERAGLLPLYEAIPSTPKEAAQRVIVVQKGSQLGMTV